MDSEMRKRLGYIARVVFIVVTLIVCVSGLVWVFNSVFSYGSSDVPTITTPQVPREQPATQTDLQKTESAFGPFKALKLSATETPDTRTPAMLELRFNGTTAASTKYTVPFNKDTWKPQTHPQINAVTIDGDFVTIRNTVGRVYTVHVNQPFFLQDYPQAIVLIDYSGQHWMMPYNTAQASRQPL